MKVTMLVFTKCVRRIIRIFLRSWRKSRLENYWMQDVTSDNKVLVWLMNTLEMPLANICGHGDVQVPTRDMVMKCCRKAGLKVEKFEIRKGMRMHCVVRKPKGEGDRQ